MASFTITAASGKFTANHTGFVCGFDLTNANVPSSFWADVDADGGNIRVFESGPTRVAAHVNRFDKENESGWLWFRSDVLTGSANEFTIDTDGATQAFDGTYGRDNVWQDYQAVYFLGDNPYDYTGNGQILVNDQGRPQFFEQTATSPSLGFGHEGVATDGTHYYVFDSNAIRKYDLSWNTVTTNTDPAGDMDVAATQLGGGTIIGDKIYVSTSDATPSNQWIGVFETSDLSFVESFDITTDGLTAADFAYNPKDGLLYTIRYNTSGTPDYRKFDPADGSFQGAVSLSFSISRAQGIVFFKGALWVSVGNNAVNPDSIYHVDLDGTVVGPVFHEVIAGDTQGMDVSPDGAGIILHGSGANVVETWHPRDIGMGGGGGAHVNDDRMWTTLATTGATTFTLGATVAIDDWGDHRSFLTYLPTLGSNSNRASLSARNDTEVWQCFDNVNGSLAGSSPTLEQLYRLVCVWDGTTAKRMYVDGTLDDSDAPISAIGSTSDILVLGNAGLTNADHKGLMGFLFLRYSALAAEWIADEHDLLANNATFWTVEESGTPPSRTKVGVKKRHKDSVDIWTTPFVPGEEGDTHGATQWEITTDDDPTFANPIWQSGDDTEHLTIYNRAGKELPLPAQAALRVRARHKGLPSGLYGEWSDDDAGDQDGGVQFSTVTSPPLLFMRPMQIRPHWLAKLDLSKLADGE